MTNFELTPEAKKLVEECPYLINRLASSLERTLDRLEEDNTILEPIEIRHVEYSLDECGRNQ